MHFALASNTFPVNLTDELSSITLLVTTALGVLPMYVNTGRANVIVGEHFHGWNDRDLVDTRA